MAQTFVSVGDCRCKRRHTGEHLKYCADSSANRKLDEKYK
jgi:hypothetical protein